MLSEYDPPIRKKASVLARDRPQRPWLSCGEWNYPKWIQVALSVRNHQRRAIRRDGYSLWISQSGW